MDIVLMFADIRTTTSQGSPSEDIKERQTSTYKNTVKGWNLAGKCVRLIHLET
jgi:hypothetical protein